MRRFFRTLPARGARPAMPPGTTAPRPRLRLWVLKTSANWAPFIV
jgi:hypothetical protein